MKLEQGISTSYRLQRVQESCVIWCKAPSLAQTHHEKNFEACLQVLYSMRAVDVSQHDWHE